MTGLERSVRRLQRRNSRSHIFLLFLLLILFFCGSLGARYYAFAPVMVQDQSMTPKFKEQSVHWMCKLPQCLAQTKDRDIVWVALKNGETLVRNVLAMPGDSIEITDMGLVRTPYRNFKWKGEDAFIQSRTIYVPKKGDTLYFDKLSDVEQDYLISYLQNQGLKVSVKSTLWQGDREINIDRIGSTKIANRQVSLKEINFLPWQDRYLIELQIRQSEPGNAPIKIKRQLFRTKPAKEIVTEPEDTLKTVLGDSTADSLPPPKPAPLSEIEETLDETINEIVINRDCYFLTCTKGNSCPDSRELGYFDKDDIIGRHVEWPDKAKEKFIDPLKKSANKTLDWILSIFVAK